jgi:hypothetical protein
VDDLLQLKLHQALAATDDVPEGATIVLATGDGNVGQFSEDGFLGLFLSLLFFLFVGVRGWLTFMLFRTCEDCTEARMESGAVCMGGGVE